MTLQNAKGTRDFGPEQAIARQRLADSLRAIFELYGYSPLETPILETFEVLSSKYAGGAEILKETFKLKDQGKRMLGLRYDLTVPMCRYLATNPNTKMPFKRYQIGEVFRDGPIKLGRYRQFTQCDVDVVGVKGMAAEAEIISMIQAFFREAELDVTIRINNRKITDGLFEAFELAAEKRNASYLIIDKLAKIGEKKVREELEQKKLGVVAIEILPKIIMASCIRPGEISTFKDFFKANSPLFKEGLSEVEAAFSLLRNKENVVFDASLVRGLSYYTGTVFEVFLNNSPIKSAVAAGGRYDRMVGQMIGNDKEYPAVGVSFGLDIILDAINQQANASPRKTPTEIYVIPIKTFPESRDIAQQLRDAGLNVEIDLMERSISKNLDYSNSLGVPFAVIVGGQEMRNGKVRLRDMKTGEEKLLSLDEVAACVKEKGV